MKEDGYRRKGVLQDERGWLVVTGAKVIYMMKEGGYRSKGDLHNHCTMYSSSVIAVYVFIELFSLFLKI